MNSAPQAFSLNGETAVVTGVNGNLGPVWTRALLESGAKVLGLDLGDAARGNAASLTEEFGGRFLFRRADIRNPQELRATLEFCLERIGAPSVLVNNAGIDQPPTALPASHRVEDWPLEQFRTVIDLNLSCTFNVCQVFGGEMVRRRRGSIVNIGSLYASLSPDPALYEHIATDPPFLKPPAYGASKAGLINITRYLAAHWAPYGVRVNALSPGGVLSAQDEAFVRKYSARVPMKRMADPSDLAGPLVFLASAASRYVTGIELLVDGGFSVW